MENLLLERIQLLVESEQISAYVQNYVISSLIGFEKHFGIRLLEENGAGFVTHYALACSRLERKEPHEEYPDSLLELIHDNPDCAHVARDLLSGVSVSVTDAEVAFLTTYICMLRESVQGSDATKISE